jgi:hypothetical protein
VLDRGIGEHPLDVAPAVQHEGGEQERHESHADHQRPGGKRVRVRGKQDLEAQQRVKCHVEQQS